jgi:hypothetical protein
MELDPDGLMQQEGTFHFRMEAIHQLRWLPSVSSSMNTQTFGVCQTLSAKPSHPYENFQPIGGNVSRLVQESLEEMVPPAAIHNAAGRCCSKMAAQTCDDHAF